jgi:hypothetical protein
MVAATAAVGIDNRTNKPMSFKPRLNLGTMAKLHELAEAAAQLWRVGSVTMQSSG